MPAFILCSVALLVFAVSIQLLSFGYQPAALVSLFLSLPVTQQISWAAICLVPLSLISVALLQYSKLNEQRRNADILETRLHGVRQELFGVEETQRDSEQAAQYLLHSDPEQAIGALQGRMSHTDQLIQVHQQCNQNTDLPGRVEEMRQQQQQLRDKLGDAIAKRRSLETLFTQLKSSQDDMERNISVIEEDKNGETLGERIQKLSEFSTATDARCEEIESAMRDLMELGLKFTALESRVAPLSKNDTGVAGVLAALSRVRDRLTETLARLEQDEGVGLEERIHHLSETKCELDERVSAVVAQFSVIGTLHKDITALFGRLNQIQRIPREFDASGRIVAITG
jgi:chromosome segregation ATPase